MAEEKKPVGGQEETSKADSTPDEAIPEAKEKELTKIRSRNFMVLVHYLEKQDINPTAFLHTSKATIKRISTWEAKRLQRLLLYGLADAKGLFQYLLPQGEKRETRAARR